MTSSIVAFSRTRLRTASAQWNARTRATASAIRRRVQNGDAARSAETDGPAAGVASEGGRRGRLDKPTLPVEEGRDTRAHFHQHGARQVRKQVHLPRPGRGAGVGPSFAFVLGKGVSAGDRHGRNMIPTGLPVKP